MDATVQVALVGICTTAITTAGVIFVAFYNNKKERGQAAESAMERTLRERIVLRDEQIKDLQNDITDLKQDVKARDVAIHARDKIISRLTEENELLKEGRL